MIALVLTLAVFAGVGIFWATRLDRADRAAYHLMHFPNVHCPECGGE